MADVYTLIWVRPEYNPSVAFVYPIDTADKKQLVGFHISIPMVYMELSTFISTVADMVKEVPLATIYSSTIAPPLPLG